MGLLPGRRGRRGALRQRVVCGRSPRTAYRTHREAYVSAEWSNGSPFRLLAGPPAPGLPPARTLKPWSRPCLTRLLRRAGRGVQTGPVRVGLLGMVLNACKTPSVASAAYGHRTDVARAARCVARPPRPAPPCLGRAPHPAWPRFSICDDGRSSARISSPCPAWPSPAPRPCPALPVALVRVEPLAGDPGWAADVEVAAKLNPMMAPPKVEWR